MKRLRCFLGAALFGIGKVCTGAAVAADSAGNAKDGGTDLKSLQQEQIATLSKRVDILTRQYQAGAAVDDQVLTAQMELCEAKLDAADTPAERIAVLEEQLKMAESAEKLAQKQWDVGRVTEANVLAARSLTLKLKIKLARLRDKQAAR